MGWVATARGGERDNISLDKLVRIAFDHSLLGARHFIPHSFFLTLPAPQSAGAAGDYCIYLVSHCGKKYYYGYTRWYASRNTAAVVVVVVVVVVVGAVCPSRKHAQDQYDTTSLVKNR
jgi:hypothetical protein